MTEDQVAKMLRALGRRRAEEPVPERDPESLKAAVRRRVESLPGGPVEPKRPVMVAAGSEHLVAASEGSPAPAATGTPSPLRRVTSGPGADRWKGPDWDGLKVRAELLAGDIPSLQLINRPADWQVAAECIVEPDQLPVEDLKKIGARRSADKIRIFRWAEEWTRIALHVEVPPYGEAGYLGCVLLERDVPGA